MLSSFKGKQVLITGGLGFIGSNLAIELVTQGAIVTIIDLPDGQFGANEFNVSPIQNNFSLLSFDIRESQRLSSACVGMDAIFCLAGQVSHSGSMRQPLLDLDLNCRCQLAVLEACRQSNRDARIVYASTRQLYGRPHYLPVDEGHPVMPVDVNGISKLAAEQFFSLYHRVYGIRSTCLRLTNTYGPRMDLQDSSKGFVGVFLAQALQGQPLSIFGDGNQRRDFNHVDDVVTALIRAALHDEAIGSVFNLAHPRPCSLLQFAELLTDIIPVPVQCVPFPDDRKAIDVGDYFGSAARFERVTGWIPHIDLADGLKSTVEYFVNYRNYYLK